MSLSLKKLACLFSLLHYCSALPPATSHQSIVNYKEGWRYSYGIVHGPKGVGYATGESYPHGYGGFGTYAPSYGHGSYGLTGHELPASHPVVSAHPGLVSDPVLTSYLEHHELPSLVLHEPHHHAFVPSPPILVGKPEGHGPLITHEYVPSPPILIGKPEHHHEIVPSHEIVIGKPEHHEFLIGKPEHHEILLAKPEHHEILLGRPEHHEVASHPVIASPPVVVGKPSFDAGYSSLFDDLKGLYAGPSSYPAAPEAHYSLPGPYAFASPSSYGPSYSHGHSPVSFSFSYHR